MKKIPVRKIGTAAGEPLLSSSFSIRRVENVLRGREMVQELHRHDYFFLLALEKGSGSHEIDFVPQRVDDRTIFILRPGQVHRLSLQASSRGYLVLFAPDFYAPENPVARHVLRKAGHANRLCIPGKGFSRLSLLLSEMLDEFSGKREACEEAIRALLSIFFIELIRHRRNRRAVPAKKQQPERLEVFLELLEKHLTEHKEVRDYAALMHLTVYQLNAILKAALGKTCSQLINEQLVLESKRLLLATTNQVKEVAYTLGFEDVSYFIRFFRKHTGYSPESFRQHFR